MRGRLTAGRQRRQRLDPSRWREEDNASFQPRWIRLSPPLRRETQGGSIAHPTGNRQGEQRVREPEALRAREARPHREPTRHGCSHLNVTMAETGFRSSRAVDVGEPQGEPVHAALARASAVLRPDAACSQSSSERVTEADALEPNASVSTGGQDLARRRHGGTRSGSWLRHRLTAVAQVRLWLSRSNGLFVERRWARSSCGRHGVDARCLEATESVRGRLDLGKGSSSRNEGAMGPSQRTSKDAVVRLERGSTEAGRG